MDKDKCETCKHNNDSGTEYCGTCAGGVESNWVEAGWIKDKRIKELEAQLARVKLRRKNVMNNIEQTIREFVPHSAEYCVKGLTEALKKLWLEMIKERRPKEKLFLYLSFYEKGYNQALKDHDEALGI